MHQGHVIIFYDDGIMPPAYRLADLYEYLRVLARLAFNRKLPSMYSKLSYLASVLRRYQEVDNAIREVEDKIHIQNIKEDFVLKRR